MIKREPGYWIPYVIGAVAMMIVWPFAIGFFITSQLSNVTHEKHHTALAIAAVAVGVLCMILAQKYLGYDLHGTLSGYDD